MYAFASVSRMKQRTWCLVFVFIICAIGLHILEVFHTQIKGKTQQKRSLATCRTNIKYLLDSKSHLKYQCSLLCKTLERETKRLHKIESANEILREQSELSRKQSKLLIISYKRSGSSFLGEIFNRHQDVFYLYEPLHSLALVGKEGTAIHQSMVKHLLRVVISCQFEEHPYYVGYSNYGNFRVRSRVLSQGCISKWRPEKPSSCANIDPKTMTALCKSHQHIVLKSIRIRSFDTLKSVLGSIKTYRILHLVRDPRAVINSRRNLNEIESRDYKSNDTLYKSVRELCREMLTKLKQGAAMEVWNGNYHVVRYEDVATRPTFAVKNLYDFVGLKHSKDVFEWIKKHTNAEKETDSFSISKNATVSVNKWKAELDLSTTRIVETECREVMHVLGYKLIGNRSANNRTGIYINESTTLNINHGQGLFVTKSLEYALKS